MDGHKCGYKVDDPLPSNTTAQYNCSYDNPRLNLRYRNNQRPDNFRRAVDFLTSAPDVGSRPTRTVPEGYEDKEYFTSDNDPSYVAWQQKLHREHVAEAERLSSLTRVPPEITAFPGHSSPAKVEITSQEIGQYLDLLPRPPYRYPEVPHARDPPYSILVRFKPSNFADHPPVPDHGFAIPNEELLTPDGKVGLHGVLGANYRAEPPGVIECQPHSFRTSKLLSGQYRAEQLGVTECQPHSFRTSKLVCGQIVGERGPGEKFFPYLHPIGLELNRFNAGKGGDFVKWAYRGRGLDLGHTTVKFPCSYCTDVTRADCIL